MRLAGARIRGYADRTVGAGDDLLVDVGAEGQALLPADAVDVHLDRGEGDVLDLDAAALDRGHQPVAAVGLATQHGGEKTDQRFAADRRTVIEPRAIATDTNAEVTAFPSPARRARGPAGNIRLTCRPAVVGRGSRAGHGDCAPV